MSIKKSTKNKPKNFEINIKKTKITNINQQKTKNNKRK